MIKKVFFLFVLISTISFSQEKKLDSIKQLLETYKKEDTTRVSMLIDLTKYYHSRDFNDGLPLAQEALALAKKIGYKRGEGYSLNSLSTFYVIKGELDKGIAYALQAKKILEEIKDTDNLIFTHNLLARIYTKNQQPEKALELHIEYYKEALRISEAVNFETGIAIATSSLGFIYHSQGDYQKAIEVTGNILPFYKKYNQEFNVANSQTLLSESYFSLNNYSEAIKRNQEAIDIYELHKRYGPLKDAYLKQHNYYQKIKNYTASNAFLKLHYTMVDSLFSSEKVQVIEDLQTKYETEKIEAQKDAALVKATLAETESKKNRNYFIGASIISLLIILSSLFFFGRLRERKKAELITIELRETQKRLALEKQYRESELKALKSQMNPHFIFNALNSIQEYIILNKKNLASDYLGKFADLIRTYLHHSDTGVISLQEEIDSLKTYLDLECLRFEDTLNYTFNVANDLNSDIIHIPTMLLQPYIENALKHGLLHKKEDRKISVSFLKGGTNNIQCTIIDNGVGREKSREFQKKRAVLHKSFAAKATEERLELLNFGKHKKIGVEIIDLYSEEHIGNGTKVIVSIPILKH